jgi:hypothetical protein
VQDGQLAGELLAQISHTTHVGCAEACEFFASCVEYSHHAEPELCLLFADRVLVELSTPMLSGCAEACVFLASCGAHSHHAASERCLLFADSSRSDTVVPGWKTAYKVCTSGALYQSELAQQAPFTTTSAYKIIGQDAGEGEGEGVGGGDGDGDSEGESKGRELHLGSCKGQCVESAPGRTTRFRRKGALKRAP